jgi:hypothetical protein
MTVPKIALCFYGIARSLPQTAPLIHEQITGPLQNHADILRLGHFFDKSAEADEPVEHDVCALLGLDEIQQEAPGACLEQWDFNALLAAGDYWNNGGVSLRNLIHQLHSLKQVTQMALRHDVTHCLFLRPDLLYHDSFAPHLNRMLAAPAPLAMIPNWQHWKGGMNDRFAFCIGPEAIRAWGMRADLMHRYCQMTQTPLQSERLVTFALWAHGIPDQSLRIRASRLRANGILVKEDFLPHPLRRFRQRRRLMGNWKRRGIARGFARGFACPS